MNAVEIEQGLSELPEKDFDGLELSFQSLAAFGSKVTTIQRLLRVDNNTSDLPGGVMQRDHIHTALAEPCQVGKTLTALKASRTDDKGAE